MKIVNSEDIFVLVEKEALNLDLNCCRKIEIMNIVFDFETLTSWLKGDPIFTKIKT